MWVCTLWVCTLSVLVHAISATAPTPNKAFADCNSVTLYADSEETWTYPTEVCFALDVADAAVQLSLKFQCVDGEVLQERFFDSGSCEGQSELLPVCSDMDSEADYNCSAVSQCDATMCNYFLRDDYIGVTECNGDIPVEYEGVASMSYISNMCTNAGGVVISMECLDDGRAQLAVFNPGSDCTDTPADVIPWGETGCDAYAGSANAIRCDLLAGRSQRSSAAYALTPVIDFGSDTVDQVHLDALFAKIAEQNRIKERRNVVYFAIANAALVLVLVVLYYCRSSKREAIANKEGVVIDFEASSDEKDKLNA